VDPTSPNLARTSQHCTFVSEFVYLAVFSNAGGSKISDVLNDTKFRTGHDYSIGTWPVTSGGLTNMYEQARNNMMDYVKNTGVYAKLKGRLSESTLLVSTCDYDSLSKKDNKILKEALFQFLHQVNRTI